MLSLTELLLCARQCVTHGTHFKSLILDMIPLRKRRILRSLSNHVVSPGWHRQLKGGSEFEPMFIRFHGTFSSSTRVMKVTLRYFIPSHGLPAKLPENVWEHGVWSVVFWKELSRFFTFSGSSEITRGVGLLLKGNYVDKVTDLKLLPKIVLESIFLIAAALGFWVQYLKP